ncbi:MAG: amidohydrolase family protein, partial [Candidatus Latescibacteria bacterium]|nr:amidohydrolase family protein [Candidatus Latescibacterota bacterium]NIT01376.1 amidohydrolase family protein [Candidatus Latescibacterota bacterium]
HVMELDEQLREYIGPPYKDLEWHRSYSFWPGLTMDGYLRSLRKPGGWAGGGSGPSAQDWLSFLDKNHIELTVLYPTQGLTHAAIQDCDWAITLARAYNDWLYHRFMQVSPRLVGVALLPVQDISEAVKELRRCVNELGMVGAVLPAVAIGGKLFSGQEFYPLWEEAQRLDVPISTHGGLSFPNLGLDLAGNFTVAHCLEHPFAQMRQLVSMVFEGVFELFPRLRYGCLECGVGWVPFMMDRMDEEMERKAQYSPRCKKKPSDYFENGNIFFAAEVGESALPLAAQLLPDHVFLWASDYPHERDQRDFSEDIPTLIGRKDISEELKRKIFFENPLRFYPGLRARAEKQVA